MCQPPACRELGQVRPGLRCELCNRSLHNYERSKVSFAATPSAFVGLVVTGPTPHNLTSNEATPGAIMSDLAFLDETSADSGLIAADRLSDLLHITRAELATAVGLSRDSISKSTRVGSPSTQARLRDVVEIINRVRGWAGTPQQAFAWYRSQPLPSFGDQTAEALVKEGRAEAVKRHLDRIAVGGYA